MNPEEYFNSTFFTDYFKSKLRLKKGGALDGLTPWYLLEKVWAGIRGYLQTMFGGNLQVLSLFGKADIEGEG